MIFFVTSDRKQVRENGHKMDIIYTARYRYRHCNHRHRHSLYMYFVGLPHWCCRARSETCTGRPIGQRHHCDMTQTAERGRGKSPFSFFPFHCFLCQSRQNQSVIVTLVFVACFIPIFCCCSCVTGIVLFVSLTLSISHGLPCYMYNH